MGLEEVVQFEARRGARDTDSKKSRAKVIKKSANTDESEDEEELAANRPTRKKVRREWREDVRCLPFLLESSRVLG